MVTRRRLRNFFTTLALYMCAAALIGYFALNAYSGDHGIRAMETLQAENARLSAELARLKAERGQWERRVALLRSQSLDPDMLDERAREMLDYVHPRDLILIRKDARN